MRFLYLILRVITKYISYIFNYFNILFTCNVSYVLVDTQPHSLNIETITTNYSIKR